MPQDYLSFTPAAGFRYTFYHWRGVQFFVHDAFVFESVFKIVHSGEDSFVPKFVSIAGAVNDQSPITQSEAVARVDLVGNLDAETILGSTLPLKLKIFGTGTATTLPPFNPDLSAPTNTNEPFLEWLLGMKDAGLYLPNIVSTSYGDNEQTVPLSFARKVYTQFATLGLQGVSLFFAASDSGVGKYPYCCSNGGKMAGFVPTFPQAAPMSRLLVRQCAASIFALANDARIAKKKRLLGFLNSALYSSKVSSGFTHITNGSAAGCGVVGFQAADGWNAATGLSISVGCESAHYLSTQGLQIS